MNIIPRNPLSSRPIKPDTPLSKRLHSINHGKAPASRTHPRSVQRTAGNANSTNGESTTTSHRSATQGYGPLLRDTLAASRQAHQSWLEKVRGEIDLVESTQQAHVRLLQEERKRIAEEEIERERRAIQQRLDAHEARLLEIAREQQAVEEQRQRAAEQRILEAEQRRADEEAALEARERQIAEEIARQQEEQEEAERVRRARERECTVCFERFDMGLMAHLGCDHWYCIEHIQSM
jgi:hypothetical protein